MEIKGDKEIILEAVRHHGSALGYAVKALRADREVVLTALRHDVTAFRFANESVLDARLANRGFPRLS